MTSKPQLSIRGLYKIFGPNPKDVLPHVLAGMG